jgi:hypothetical protein
MKFFIFLSLLFSSTSFATNCRWQAEKDIKNLNKWATKISAHMVNSNPKSGYKVMTGTQAYKVEMY